jgi:fucose permease
MAHPLLIASAAAGGLAIGFVPAAVDCLKDALRQRLNLPGDRVGRLLSVFYRCWLPAMPLAGWLLDHWQEKDVLFLGLLGCVLGIAWLGLSQSPASLLASVAVLGAGYSAVACAAIRLMPEALALTPRSSTVATLNVGFVFVIAGAVLAPWVVGWVVRRWGCRQGLLYLSFAFIVPAVLVIGAPREHFPDVREPLPWAAVLADVRLWLLAAVILLYFALENCLDVWPEPYLKELGYGGRRLTAAMLLFWGAFTLARLAAGWLPATHYHYEPWLLLLFLLASGFTMGNLVGAHEYSTGGLGFWLTGACYGPLLPGFLALVLDLFPRLPGTALGLMLALSGLDTLIVRPFMTVLARRAPARTVMIVPTVLAVVIAAPLLVLALIR